MRHNIVLPLLPNVSLLAKGYLVSKPIGFGNKFSVDLSGQRRSDLLSRPGALVHKLLQSQNIPSRRTKSSLLLNRDDDVLSVVRV
jgi:hypothetical protein